MSTAVTPLPTQVIGLDQLLHRGLILPHSDRGLLLLIKGVPGTGKTTLALQLANAVCQWTDRSLRDHLECVRGKAPEGELAAGAAVYSCEQDPSDLKALCTRLGIQTQTESTGPGLKIRQTASSACESAFDSASYPLEWAVQVTVGLAESEPKPRTRAIVIDGLNLLSAEERHTLEVARLIEVVRARALVGIIVYEGDPNRFECIDYLVDCVIEMRGEEVAGPPPYFLNRLSVTKSRFQKSGLGWHQYKIRDEGVSVFVSVHFRVSQMRPREQGLEGKLRTITQYDDPDAKGSPIPPKENSILANLLGVDHIKKGSCTVVLGARRAYKTLLTLDFLRDPTTGSRQNSMLVSLMDNQSTIASQRRLLCERFCRCKSHCGNHENCYKHIYLWHLDPGCIAPGEFYHYLDMHLSEIEAKEGGFDRLLFWDLTQLEYRFPLLNNDRLFIPLLMDSLKHRQWKDKNEGVTSLFMGAANTTLARCASAIADNVVFCWQDVSDPDGTKDKGVAIYVDRTEGKPERGDLYFIADPKGTDPTPILEAPEKFVGGAMQPESLMFAESMLRGIRAMQGLPADKRHGDDDPPRHLADAGKPSSD